MRLFWYILRLHIGPFLFGTSCVVFIFLLQLVFKTLAMFTGKGIGLDVIAQFFLYSVSWMLVLAVPMGTLFASLMAYGTLSGNNELTIVKSAGGSAIRAMVPSVILGAVVFGLLFWFDDQILPETNQRVAALQQDIQNLQPVFAVEPGQFSSLQGYNILARNVDRARNRLLNVTIYAQNGPELRVINARQANLEFNADYSKLLMTLLDGEVLQLNRVVQAEFRKIAFSTYTITIETSGYTMKRSDPASMGRSDRSMSIADMRAIADTSAKVADRARRRYDSMLNALSLPPGLMLTEEHRTRQESAGLAMNALQGARSVMEMELGNSYSETRRADQFWVEIHKKYAIPLACLVFILVGAPLGIVVRRGNFGVSAAIALGFFVVYWACLVGGEKLADRNLLPPALAMYGADILIGLVGIYLTILVSRETVTFSFDFSRFKRRGRGTGLTPG